jgi:hypothetical protein
LDNGQLLAGGFPLQALTGGTLPLNCAKGITYRFTAVYLNSYLPLTEKGTKEINNMKPSGVHENFPVWTVIVSNLGSIFTYGTGFLIMHRTGLVFSILYLVYVVILEYRLIRFHCVNCYYWGKICGFGKGRISSFFFKNGDFSKFCIKDISWKDMIPDLLVTLIPLTTGIFLLIFRFDTLVLMAIVLLLVLATVGNGYIRGHLICKYCKQRELGCPAYRLFNNK